MYKHLLPGRWGNNVLQLFTSISNGFNSIRNEIDLCVLDMFPSGTRELMKWEEQFGLSSLSSLTTDQRRARIAAEWAAFGGQGKDYIQGVLQAAGFLVYVHEWWGDEFSIYDAWYCGDVGAECGESGVECASPIPTTNDPGLMGGYVLVNKIPERDITTFTTDPQTFPYYLYIGGENFGDIADVPAARRDELEKLILKIRPLHLRLCMLINYT